MNETNNTLESFFKDGTHPKNECRFQAVGVQLERLESHHGSQFPSGVS